MDKAVIVPEGLGSPGDTASLAAAQTPCEAMGKNEVTLPGILVKPTDEVIWRVFLCTAPAMAVLGITDEMGRHKVLVNQQIPPPNPLSATVMPPPTAPGRYVLIWTLTPLSGTDWQMVVEVAVKGTTVFRRFKSAASKLPGLRGFLFMEVQ